MESVLGRYRNLIVLVTVLFAQVLGLAVQVKRNTDTESTRLIRVWAVGAVTPPEKVLHWFQTSTSGIWHNYLYLRGIRAENRELRHEIEQLQIEQARMTQDADQAHRLQALFLFKEQFISQTLAAQVIGSSGSEQSRSLYIDKGARDGIKPDMAVITRDGIIGKVLQVYGAHALEPSTAQVLLINDQTSGVGVILDKTRLQGILRGTPSGEVVLEKVMSDETVPVGEMVLTSGGDGIFPKGLPVGTVTKVSPGSDLFLNIHVRPSASLNRIEEVLVVTKIDERQAHPEQTGPVRAIDILAERLPSVPPKADAAVTTAGKGTAAQTGAAAATAQSSANPTPNGGSSTPGQTATAGQTAPTGVAAGAAKPKPPTVSGTGTPITAAPPTATNGSSTQTSPVGRAAQAAVPGAASTNQNSAPTKKSAVVSGASAGAATSPAAAGTGSTLTTPSSKPVTKPVNSTVAPKPQPAAEDTPQ